MTESIPIFCATDENYAPFAATMIKSVLMHTDALIDFYIMDGGIQKKTQKLIERDLKEYPNKKLHFVDMTKYNLDQFPNLSYYSTNTFSRYFIPSIAPKIKKAIYLDVDIIVKQDIRRLYNQDLEEYPIGAVPEDFFYWSITRLKRYIWPQYQPSSLYFNAGVLLMDIQKLIHMDFTQKAIELTAKLYHKLSCPDQDVLNILFENNYKKLNYEFDFFPDHVPFLRKKHPEIFPIEPIIIHYISSKPWKEHSVFQQDFDDVLRTSVFYKQVIKKYRSQKASLCYLFGIIPICQKIKKK